MKKTVNKSKSLDSQYAIYWREHRRIADANECFMWLVLGGMTKHELELNINKRPALWSRYSNWLDKLK